MTKQFVLSRRGFLKIGATAAGGLLVSGCFKTGNVRGQSTHSFTPHAFVKIDPDNAITIWFKSSEIGQNVKTSMCMLIADELEADWDKVKILQADLDPKRYGPQGSGGSDNLTSEWDNMRMMGAVAREMLITAAADNWKVERETCIARKGEVIHQPSGKKATYGSLADAASKISIPKVPPKLKEPKDFRIIGTVVNGVDNKPIASGKPLFGLDVRVPGMLRANVERCPVFNGKVASFDASKALAVPGVRQVVKIDGLPNPTHLMSGVAVVADSTWAAMKGREALTVTWDEGAVHHESTDGLYKQFRDLSAKEGKVLRNGGDVEAAFAKSAKVVEADYQAPFLAHVTMEPQNCVAHVQDGKCEVWGPMQSPGSARRIISAATGIPVDAIQVHLTRIGGGFGRRLLSDYAAESACISKAVGAPVQVVWTREDDFQHDYYRPAGYHRVKAGLDAQGNITAWKHRLVNVSRNAYRKDDRPPESTEIYGLMSPKTANMSEDNSTDLVQTLIPNYRLEYTAVDTGIPTGAWRAPAHNVNAFVIATFLDALAHAAGRAPVDLRLSFLGEKEDFPYTGQEPTPYNPTRMKQVLRVVAEKASWGKPSPSGIGRGIAGHFTFGSYIAHVAEVSVDSKGKLKIHRVVSAIDTGITVSPNGIEAQAQGGVIDGLSAAFFGGVTIESGRVKESNFADYRMLRINEAPKIEIHIIKSNERPTGFGEIALPPIAPAVANAYFAVTGKRIRQMPFRAAGMNP